MLHNINEDMLLNENIPQDLIKAYRKAQGTASQRNPETLHQELGAGSRGTIKYAYGKANYDEISKEEAINLVKQDKHNVQKLRILYNGDLVEYEVRDNGSVYCIYGNRDIPFTADDGKYYKNIAFAPFRKVVEVADKIYLTDEYDFLIRDSQPDLQARREKSHANAKVVGSTNKDLNRQSQFTPGTNYYTNVKVAVPGEDTGAHTLQSIDRVRRIEDRIGSGSSQYSIPYSGRSAASRIVSQYQETVDNKKIKKRELKTILATIRKLENEKEEYTQEEYEALKNKYTRIQNRIQKEYDELLAEETKYQKQIITNINDANIELNQKIGKYLIRIETLIARNRDLKNRCVKLTQEKSSPAYSSDNSRLREIIKKLINTSEKLEDLQQTLSNNANLDQIPVEDASISEVRTMLQDQINAFKAIKKAGFDRQLSAIHSDESTLSDIEREVEELENEFHPARQAKKARQKVANKKELDPSLADIITFED